MEIFGFPLTLSSFLLIVLILLLTYAYLTWNHDFWVKRGIPGPKPLPGIGNMHLLLTKNVRDLDLEYVKKYGKVVGEFLYGPSLVIADSTIAKRILVKDFNNFPDRTEMERSVSEHDKFASRMLINLTGDEWKRVRTTVTPAFSVSKLKVMIEEINLCCDILLENLIQSKNEEIDTVKFTGAFTMDVIARVGFGVSTDAQKDPKNPFVQNGRKIFDTTFDMKHPEALLMHFAPKLFAFLQKYFPERFTLFPKEANDFFVDLIRKIMKQRGQQMGNLDMVQLMLNAHTEKLDEIDTEIGGKKDKTVNRKGLTEEEIVGQSILIMIAGFETTSSTLGFVMYNLATNIECQEKLQQEIDEVVGNNEIVSYETSNKLPYLDMCINETLRLYPPAPRTERQSNQEVTIEGVTIPKNITVGISIVALHYDPEVWPEPTKFDPERFSAEAKSARDPIHFMPFGAGPRNCIGMRLAQLELRIGLVRILQKFNIRPSERTQIPLKLEIGSELTKAEKGIFVKLEPRK